MTLSHCEIMLEIVWHGNSQSQALSHRLAGWRWPLHQSTTSSRATSRKYDTRFFYFEEPRGLRDGHKGNCFFYFLLEIHKLLWCIFCPSCISLSLFKCLIPLRSLPSLLCLLVSCVSHISELCLRVFRILVSPMSPLSQLSLPSLLSPLFLLKFGQNVKFRRNWHIWWQI